MRSVEVAVGYVGGQWESVWVKVVEPMYSDLDDEQITGLAETLALDRALKMKQEVSFTRVLHIEEPSEDRPFS